MLEIHTSANGQLGLAAAILTAISALVVLLIGAIALIGSAGVAILPGLTILAVVLPVSL